MATLRETLKNNPYKEQFIFIINYFNNTQAAERNPFEALLVATILAQRLGNWNGGGLEGPNPGPTTACIDENGKPYVLEGWGPCPDKKPNSTSRANYTFIDSIVSAAELVRAPNPYTSAVKNFEQMMSGITMNQVNNYAYFMQGIDEYYKNVSFISYFTNDYFDGFYFNTISRLIGGDVRPGYNGTGLLTETIAEGSASTPEISKINFKRAIASDLNGKYFTMSDGVTGGGDKYLFYYEYNGEVFDPANFGVPFSFAFPIKLAGGCPPPAPANTTPPCPEPSNAYVKEATDAVILSTTIWIISSEGDLYTQYTAVANKVSDNIDGQTANYGPGNQLETLVAPDGTVYPGTFESDSDWAFAYNTIVVPGELAKGNRIAYVKPVFRKGYPECPCPAGDNDCFGPPCPGDGDTGSLMLRTTYNPIVAFNIPKSTFAARSEDKARCVDCLI